MKFSAVILAGGKSSRMGRDKAWIEYLGKPLLERQIELAREAGASEIFVSSRGTVDYSRFGCRTLSDRFNNAGPLAGIESALAVASNPLVLVLAVDMPLMNANLLHRIQARAEKGLGVIPRCDGVIEPFAAFYSQQSKQLLDEMLETSVGHRSGWVKQPQLRASEFAKKSVESGLARFIDVSSGDSAFFFNWNSPEQIT